MWILAARKGCKSPLYPTNSLWESFYTLFISPPLNFLSPLNIKKKKIHWESGQFIIVLTSNRHQGLTADVRKFLWAACPWTVLNPCSETTASTKAFTTTCSVSWHVGADRGQCDEMKVWSVSFSCSAHLKIITDALLQIHLHCWNQSLPHVTSCLTFKHRRACILKLLHLFTASHDSREAIKHVSWLITLLQSCHSLGGTCRSLQPRWVLSDCWVTSGVLV